MGFREIVPKGIDSSFFEKEAPASPTGPAESGDPGCASERNASSAEYPAAEYTRFSLSKLHRYIKFIPDVSVYVLLSRRIVMQIVLGLIAFALGIVANGTYYGPAPGRLFGIMGVVFYQYQLGTVLIVIGAIALYDVIKRAGSTSP